MQDRVPPQNIEAEQSVIGAMLIDKKRGERGNRKADAGRLLPAGSSGHLQRDADASFQE